MAKIGVQLYTLREQLEEDFVGTLERVAEVGYGAVELHSFGNMTPLQLRTELDRIGLKAMSCHVALVRLEEELPQVIEEAKILGLDYIVCPWLPETRRDAADFVTLAETLKTVAQTCRENGLKLAYHNHDFEFAQFNGSFALDTLLKETAADGVQAELDVYWIDRAGQSPVEYISRYAGRCDLLHVKDASKEDGSFESVGSGRMDFDAIFSAAEKSGVQWYIVEQDICKGDPLDAIASSLAYVKKHV